MVTTPPLTRSRPAQSASCPTLCDRKGRSRDEEAASHRRQSPYERAGLLNRAVYWWMAAVLQKARRVGLTQDDIYDAPPWEGSRMLTDKLNRFWQEAGRATKSVSRNALLWSIFRANAGSLFLIISLALTLLLLRSIQPILVAKLILLYQTESELSPVKLSMYIGILLISNILILLLYSANEFVKCLLAMRMRTACTGITFQKVMSMSTQSLRTSSTGQIMTILSTDVERFLLLGRTIDAILTAPFEITLFIVLVSFELKSGTPAFVALALLCITTHCLLATYQGSLRRVSSSYTDTRVSMMSEVITAMRVVKMHTWENPLIAKARALRRAETAQLLRTDMAMCVNLSLGYYMGRIIIYCAALCALFFHIEIPPESALRIIGWVKMVDVQLFVALPVCFSLAFDIATSINRIQEFLLIPDIATPKSCDATITNDATGHCVLMRDAYARWDTTLEKGLFMVVGPVGSGKSSLLLGILGELALEKGQRCVQGKVAYVPQEPWVVSGSVRHNVIMGEEFDEERYRDAIKMSSLTEDIVRMTCGDQTQVGERGLSLSGGQKTRLNLARALYRDADIYLLDSPLSAVDAKVASHMFHSCIKKYLSEKIVILVSHHREYLHLADVIICLDKGKIAISGSFEEVSEVIKLEDDVLEINEDFGSDDNTEAGGNKDDDFKMRHVDEALKEKGEGEGQSAEGEGHLSGASVLHYLRAGRAYVIMPICILFLLLAQGSGLFCDWWILHWTSLVGHNVSNDSQWNGNNDNLTASMTVMAGPFPLLGFTNSHDSTTHYFVVYTGVLLFSVVMGLLFAALAVKMVALASNQLYHEMLDSVIHAPMSFFERESVGKILNHFCRDMVFLDDLIPFSLTFLFNELAYIVGALTYTAVISPWALVAASLFLTALITIRQYVMVGARDIRRLETKKRSPTFSLLHASLKGIHVIRAHQLQDQILRRAYHAIDGHTGAWHMLLAAQRWLSVRSDLVAYSYLTLVLIVMPFLPLNVESWSVYGLSLFYMLRLISTTSLATREGSDLEIHMMCVERVRQYALLPQEAPPHSEHRVPVGWPQQGHVELRNVSVSYSEGPKALKDINLNIEPSQKIGIVGRTGSGKTTLMMGILRIQEPDGHVIIDGMDTRDLSLPDLRRNIAVIPQDPVLFSGTVRNNIDPFDEYSDDQLQDVLEQIELWDTVSGLKNGLRTLMAEGGGNFSVGQRQLLCLGRALLKQSKLVLIDEATANVDHRTDALIQRTLKRGLKGSTVLNIAHRLNTVIDYDKIVVLDRGRVVQYGHAHQLLQDREGAFLTMVTQTGSLEMLQQRARTAFNSQLPHADLDSNPDPQAVSPE